MAKLETGLEILSSAISDNPKLRVVYKPGCPAADIEKGVLYIPPINALENDEDKKKLRAYFYHESMHILHTKVVKPEGPVGMIMNALEDVRIENLGGKTYAGLRETFNWANKYYNQKRASETGEVSSPIYDALTAMMFQVQGIKPSFELSDIAQEIIERTYSDFQTVYKCRNTNDVIKLSEVIFEKIKDLYEEQEKEKSEEGDEGEGGEGGKSDKGEDGESDGESESGSESEKGEGASDSDGGSSKEEEVSVLEGKGDIEGKRKRKKSRRIVKAKLTKEEKAEIEAEIEKAVMEKIEEELKEVETKEEKLKEELDEIFKTVDWTDIYTSNTEMDSLETVKITTHHRNEYEKLKSEVAPYAMGLAQTLDQAFRTMSRKHKDNYKYAGKLDMKRLVSIGKSLSKNVFYSVRQGMTLDTAVSILVDESGSMGYKMRPNQIMAIAIGEALTKIGIPFEMIGHTASWSVDEMTKVDSIKKMGYTRCIPIKLRQYKAFNEQWQTVAARTSDMRSRSENVDGEALNYILKRLQQRSEKRKIVFVLSDGYPAWTEGNDEKGHEHLQEVIEAWRKQNYEIYGFGIGTDLPKRFYGEDHFLYLSNIKKMDIDFFKRFAEILTREKIRVRSCG